MNATVYVDMLENGAVLETNWRGAKDGYFLHHITQDTEIVKQAVDHAIEPGSGGTYEVILLIRTIEPPPCNPSPS